jgi:hypothetical protein
LLPSRYCVGMQFDRQPAGGQTLQTEQLEPKRAE